MAYHLPLYDPSRETDFFDNSDLPKVCAFVESFVAASARETDLFFRSDQDKVDLVVHIVFTFFFMQTSHILWQTSGGLHLLRGKGLL